MAGDNPSLRRRKRSKPLHLPAEAHSRRTRIDNPGTTCSDPYSGLPRRQCWGSPTSAPTPCSQIARHRRPHPPKCYPANSLLTGSCSAPHQPPWPLAWRQGQRSWVRAARRRRHHFEVVSWRRHWYCLAVHYSRRPAHGCFGALPLLAAPLAPALPSDSLPAPFQPSVTHRTSPPPHLTDSYTLLWRHQRLAHNGPIARPRPRHRLHRRPPQAAHRLVRHYTGLPGA